MNRLENKIDFTMSDDGSEVTLTLPSLLLSEMLGKESDNFLLISAKLPKGKESTAFRLYSKNLKTLSEQIKVKSLMNRDFAHAHASKIS